MKEAIKNLVGLIEEHPDMDVKLMVDNETLAEGWAYTAHIITRAEVSYYAESDGQVFTDYDDYIEELVEMREAPEEEAKLQATKEGRDVILVWTQAR